MHYTSQETINLILSLRKEGKTYDQIREVTGCAKSTISKYCVDNGLSENPKKVNEITPELLQLIQQRYYEVGSAKKVAKEFHISEKRLRQAGLKVNKPQKDYLEKGITPQASCAQKTKLKAIEYKGGKCQICGYNKCIRSMQFHHLNPNEKDFGISGGTKSFQRIQPELDKCILVCANCHGEIHDGLINLDDYNF